MALAPGCTEADSKWSPICKQCWAVSTTPQREAIKAIHNKETVEHRFCGQTGCWEVMPKKYMDTGFCGRFNKAGACQQIEVAAADSKGPEPPPPPPRRMVEFPGVGVPPVPMEIERKRSISPSSLNPLLREARACKRWFIKIEQTLIALGAEEDSSGSSSVHV